jgi:hypothetical protein
VYVYGTVTNTNDVAIKSVSVKVSGFKTAEEIVSDTTAYVSSREYLKPGQTGRFKAMLRDETGEITSTDSEVEKIYNSEVAGQ